MSDFKIDDFLKNFINVVQNVKSEFFLIPTTYSLKGIQRERIFCNELNIQFRHIFGESYPYKLHSEINKSGHPDFDNKIKNIDPDFIVHTPGTHENNLIIIEVKGNLSNKRLLYKDIEKIFNAMDDKLVHYQYGIFLVYNHSFQDLYNEVSELLGNIDTKFDDRIFVLCSPRSGSVEQKTLSDLR